ncbi:phage/plasmid primase, P4 family [Vagococcus carniphilus]|uniref:Phage/plasmid primase, P4 family n=1 Tax=Vagococcus carniphilus TaxID=218144 RepID=A0AAW8UAU7_9ENTE|nr:phage/plasmid primase, P4 family [Vagococcus carniphilus]MDT2834392.1 phage/plasmid primase, P4 family [Vagococcus carniphilus]
MKKNEEITVDDINYSEKEIIEKNTKEVARTKEIEDRLEPLVDEYGVKEYFELIKSCRDLEYTDEKFKEEFRLNKELIRANPMIQETRNNIVDVEFENHFANSNSNDRSEVEYPKYLNWDKKLKKYKVSPTELGREIISELELINSDAWYEKSENKWYFESPTNIIKNLIAVKLSNVIIDGKSFSFWNNRIEKETINFIYSINYKNIKAGELFDNSKPFLAQFDNGIYNIRTDKLQNHNSQEYILAHHPYSLNMDRELFPINTVRWFYALTGDFESVKYLIQLCGYIFYRSHAPFQIITILDGVGKNGKSIFLEFISKLVGKEYIASIPIKSIGSDQNRFASSSLYGANVNFTTENTNGFIETDMLKTLTGGDQMSAEFKGKDIFQFTNYSKQIFASNSKPSFRDSSNGFSRRLKVVNFNAEVDSIFINQHHIDKIVEEIPVFARFAMDHFNHALKEGKMAESEDMKDATDDWLYNQNSVRRFVDEECEIVDIRIGERTQLLHEAFKDFCSMEGVKELSLTNFLEELKKMGYEKKRFDCEEDKGRYMRIPGVLLNRDRVSLKFSTRRKNESVYIEEKELDSIRQHNQKMEDMSKQTYNQIVKKRNIDFEGENNYEGK